MKKLEEETKNNIKRAEELHLLGEYVTRQAHNTYPTGSICVAYRKNDGRLLLRMQDGGELILEHIWFCEGLERRGGGSDIIDLINKKVMNDIDEQIINNINK